MKKIITPLIVFLLLTACGPGTKEVVYEWNGVKRDACYDYALGINTLFRIQNETGTRMNALEGMSENDFQAILNNAVDKKLISRDSANKAKSTSKAQMEENFAHPERVPDFMNALAASAKTCVAAMRD